MRFDQTVGDGPEPQLVGVEGWNVEAPRELVTDVPRPVIGQSVVASPFLPRSERLRLEADEEGGGGVVARSSSFMPHWSRRPRGTDLAARSASWRHLFTDREAVSYSARLARRSASNFGSLQAATAASKADTGEPVRSTYRSASAMSSAGARRPSV